ncbi:MAG: response regulator [Lachnospira sp.]
MIDTCLSGKEAIEKISSQMYDIIFMDHMMPELDGVETTHIIRRFHPEYDDVPIIALTANAIDGTKEMFLKEGMNDFVPKPIELQFLTAKIKHWLPAEKIDLTARRASAKQKHQAPGQHCNCH